MVINSIYYYTGRKCGEKYIKKIPVYLFIYLLRF